MSFASGGVSRSGVVTNLGISGDDTPVMCREDSFTSFAGDVLEGDEPVAAAGTNQGIECLRRASILGDEFSIGGDDTYGSGGEGYWGKQRDPASGMAYYLNETVRLRNDCTTSTGQAR